MGDKDKKRQLETLLIHGASSQMEAAGAMLPPIVHATAFEYETAEALEEVFADRQAGMIYSRLQNPTVSRLEERITDVSGARGTLAVATGMSAITLGLLGLLRTGDEILAGRFLFGGTFVLFENTLKEMGITTRYFDPRNPEEAEALVSEHTKVVFLEAIANPAIVVPDFSAYRKLCDAHGLALLVDASLLTPVLYDQAAIGADVVFYSASKFIAGAASTLGGLIVDPGRTAWHELERFDFGDLRQKKEQAFLLKLRKRLMAGIGPSLAPMSAFLQLVGMESLSLRLERQCANAQAVAEFLAANPAVTSVSYTGLTNHPAHDLALRQFRGQHGSLMGFELASRAESMAFLNRLNLVKRATNLGDTKTIALHPASTIYGSLWPEDRERLGVSESLIRFSVGLENPEDIIADLAQALG